MVDVSLVLPEVAVHPLKRIHLQQQCTVSASSLWQSILVQRCKLSASKVWHASTHTLLQSMCHIAMHAIVHN